MNMPSDQVADHWQLPPFSDIRCIGLYDEHVRTGSTYRAFLVFVYEGRAAVARLPLVIPPKGGDIWQELDQTIRQVLVLLAQLALETRIRFHEEVDETVDLYFRIHTLANDE